MTVPIPPPPTIPTIDISPYLTSPTSSTAESVIDAIRTACTTTGFFQITGHGIPRALQDEVFAGVKAFFDLPMAEKVKLDRVMRRKMGNRGYEIMGTQLLDKDGKGEVDLKEVCGIGTSFALLGDRHGEYWDFEKGLESWVLTAS